METLNLNRLKTSFPFSTSLNDFISREFIKLINNVSIIFVEDQPYETYEQMKADYTDNNRLQISKDFSDTSIFGKPEVNWAFRAVHDMQHIRLDKDFSYQSELFITYKTIQEFRALGLSQLDIDLLTIEMGGQVVYYMEHGNFPADQREFTKQELTKLGYKIV